MKKHTKYILGAAGLLAVGGMTAVAAGLPGPEAQAANEASTTVNVTVKAPVIKTEITGEDEQGDPIAKVDYNAQVCSAKFQATNIATGDNLFNPEILYKIREAGGDAGSFQITLPFMQNGAVVGDYNIVVTAFGCDGSTDPIGSSMTRYSYNNKQPTPDVPNTGEFNVLGVNLARADYLAIGGLIIAAAIACIVLAVRKKQQK